MSTVSCFLTHSVYFRTPVCLRIYASPVLCMWIEIKQKRKRSEPAQCMANQ